MITAIWLLALGSWFSSPALAQSQPPDLPTYTGWVREAFAAAQRGDRLGLEDVAARLTGATSVRLAAGTSVSVDNNWLRVALKAEQPDLPAIAARLGAILDALAQPPSSAPADARDRLKALLDQPPFKRAEPSTPSWASSLLDWLGRLLERMLRPLGRI